ncbi:MAG: hypothetical protein LBW85_08855 [Deltaproteobacteria bacterium]|jgi:hypothetical protein|nr:hypothetical protein [Deltaproteobacteria bacterium]
MRKRSLTLAAACLPVLASGLLFGGPAAAADGPAAGAARVGEFTVNLAAPEGMSLVTGLCPKGDEFLYRMNERFKLVVLAAFARPDEYLDFCRAMERGEFRNVPNIALVTVPRKMHERSYDGKRTAKEIKRYVSWFTLATNTRIIALGLEGKANRSLTRKLGHDLDFTYALGDYTRVFHRTPTSLGVGVLASFNLWGSRSDNYVAVLVHQMGDKLIFLSMEGLDRSPQGIEALRAELLKWGSDMTSRNAPPLTVTEAKTEVSPDAAPEGSPAG